jgi:hypothetical protein
VADALNETVFITIDREDSRIVKYEAVVHAAPIPQARRGGRGGEAKTGAMDTTAILAESADKKGARRHRGKP